MSRDRAAVLPPPPTDVAVVPFYVSLLAGFITGTGIAPDGGLTIFWLMTHPIMVPSSAPHSTW